MMSGKEYATPFPMLQAVSLLSHKARIRKFRQAITKLVKSNDHVIDLGTGSGILAILAAQQGARVTAIDANSESLRYAKEAAEKMVQAKLDYSGMDDIDWLKRVNYDVSFRDYGVATVADLSTSHEGGKL